MHPNAVEIRSVSKRFRLHGKSRAFWALRDISIDVRGGEAVGIIGPNGAGKSTALKLLAGIMPPTHGEIRVRGRVSALIEVGAGFHPDLTGRENIYLNASVLGLPLARTRRKFDEIVAFAEIGDFIDMPLKRYSTGMHARLGFAVAAHVEPDVLIVDEVLSVGDRVFRAKCMDRMKSFLRHGVAVLFVSHDLTAVTNFCDRAVVLDRGLMTFIGPAVEAVAHYHRACAPERKLAPLGGERASLGDIRLSRPVGGGGSYEPGDTMRVEADIRLSHAVVNASAMCRILRLRDSVEVFASGAIALRDKSAAQMAAPQAAAGTRRLRADIVLNLLPGEYGVSIEVCEGAGDDAAPIAAAQAQMMIRGPVNAGGLVDVSPRFEISAA